MSHVSTVPNPPFIQKCIAIHLLMRPTFDSTSMVTIQDNFSPVDLQKITALYVTGIRLKGFFFCCDFPRPWPGRLQISSDHRPRRLKSWPPGAPEIWIGNGHGAPDIRCLKNGWLVAVWHHVILWLSRNSWEWKIIPTDELHDFSEE